MCRGVACVLCVFCSLCYVRVLRVLRVRVLRSVCAKRVVGSGVRETLC